MADKWEELISKGVPLASGNVTANVSIIRSVKSPSVKLVSLGKLFKSVAFKPQDWDNIIPILTLMVAEAKKPDQATQKTQSVEPDSFYSQEETDRRGEQKP